LSRLASVPEITTEVVALLLESVWLVAVTATVNAAGTEFGAVYSPVELMVPYNTVPPGTPFTVQTTDESNPVLPDTEAVH